MSIHTSLRNHTLMMAISAAAVAGAVMAGAIVTVVAVLVIVVVTVYIGVEVQLTGDQGVHRVIRAALHAAVELDAGLLERHLRTAANAAADEHIHLQAGK